MKTKIKIKHMKNKTTFKNIAVIIWVAWAGIWGFIGIWWTVIKIWNLF